MRYLLLPRSVDTFWHKSLGHLEHFFCAVRRDSDKGTLKCGMPHPRGQESLPIGSLLHGPVLRRLVFGELPAGGPREQHEVHGDLLAQAPIKEAPNG